MDLKQIHELIKIINKSNIGEISIEDKDGKVIIKQKETQEVAMQQPANQYVTSPTLQPQQTIAMPPTPPTSPIATPVVTTPTIAKTIPTTNTVTIKSPMIGTFYRKASPDKPYFVEEGTEIEIGKVLCIIEAMKLFNEIESEIKGKIVKILVENATPVEYDQPLFIVETI